MPVKLWKLIIYIYIYIYHVAGITGTVSIDANGDRNADYSLLDMNPKNGEFQVSDMWLE